VVVGNGNVALDVARILTLPIRALEGTDIAPQAVEALRASAVQEVLVLGRRGAVHAAFHHPALTDLEELPDVDVVVDARVVPADHATVDARTRRKLESLRRIARGPLCGRPRRIELRFLTSPVEILGSDRVTGVLVTRTRLEPGRDGVVRARHTGDHAVLDAGLVLRATGYFGRRVPGLPFDAARGIVPNRDGRVTDGGTPLPGVYVAGWIKRGPHGVIGTNKKCARDTVRALLADAEAGVLPTRGTLDSGAADRILRERQPDLVDTAGWLRIDDHERRLGRRSGRSRQKLTDTESLRLAALPRQSRAGEP
jgi:ferredoxin/flavodoxin---NADP+ reductase